MNKNLGGFNPSVKEFLEKKPDVTLIGLMWAMSWRFQLVIGGLAFVIAFGFTAMIASIVGNL